jgi:hypothetical protein
MSFLSQAAQNVMKQGPLLMMLIVGLFSILLEGIIFPFPAGVALAPARLDQAALLQAMQDRIKHAVRPLQLAAGPVLDFLNMA